MYSPDESLYWPVYRSGTKKVAKLSSFVDIDGATLRAIKVLVEWVNNCQGTQLLSVQKSII